MTNIPYKLPDGWKWVKLGDVCTLIESGFAFRKKGAPEGDLLHLRPYNIAEDGTLDLSQRFYVSSSLRSARHKFLQPGDVLFNNTNSVELVGKTALIREPLEAAFSNHITLLRPNTINTEGAWIALALQALWRQGFFASLCNKWIGQAGINTETLRSVLIPLPPLEEQKRIVARIEELMTRIKEAKKLRQESKEKTELLWQSALAETFPKPGTQLPDGWKWVRLSEITKGLESGKRPKGGVKKITNGIPSIGGEHITWDGGFDFSKIRYVSKEFYCSLRKGKINKGDILIVKDGATTGKTAYVSETFPFKDACINEHVYILRVDENLSISRFVFLFLISPVGQSQIKKTFHGAAQGGINSEFINQVEIPLPPLEEQKRIVAHLQALQEKIKSLKESQTHTETKLKELENSILDKAFKGEL